MKIFFDIIFFSYFISYFINCEDNFIVNLDGEDCSYASSNPEYPDECINYSTEETACCFVEIEKQDRTKINKCVEVERDARFALNHLTIFSLKTNHGEEFTDVIGRFTCGQEDKLCGMDVPEKIFQCSEHSSTTRSCCYLETPTYTECILSNKKYDKETTFTLFEDSNVYCGGSIIDIKRVFLLAFLIIFSLF